MLSWGWNQNYQLGQEDNEPRSVPQVVQALEEKRITMLACGSRFTLALTEHGNVYSWGRGVDGQLGNEHLEVGIAPKLVQELAEIKITMIATRGSHAMALSADGMVFTWGRGDDGQLGLGNRKSADKPHAVASLTERKVVVREVACGRVHSVAVSSDGDVYSWGCGEEGATGLGAASLDSVVAVLPTLVNGVERVKSVACGSRHTLALTEEHTLYAWGWGTYGQLGLGDRVNRLEPTVVSLPNKVENASFVYGQEDAPQNSRISQIACGYRHSMVIIEYDAVRTASDYDASRVELWSWGWNQYGQLGYKSDSSCVLVPRMVEDLPHEVYKVAGGGRHTLGVLTRKHDGARRLYAWGRGDDGQLGNGERIPMSAAPIRVRTAGENIALISCGWSHSFCVIEKNYTPKQLGYKSRASTRVSMRFPSMPFRPYGSGELEARASLWEMFKASDLFSFGNIDGGMAQLLNTLILFLLMLQLLHFRVGFAEPVIVSRVLPAAAWTVFISNVGFAIYGDVLSKRRSTNSGFTAIPHGIDTILFFAFALLIMVPEYQKSQSFEQAYRTCLGCCFLLGLMELPCVLLVSLFRRVIPKAAMMSALAGVSLTFISMTFVVQIFENPAIGILPMVLILVCYGSNVRLPFKLPAALVALLLGALIAYVFKWAGLGYLVPNENIKAAAGPDEHVAVYFPSQTAGEVFAALGDPATWPYVTSVVLPMMLINLVNNIACVESARSVGDDYHPQMVLTANAVITILGSLIGNPFPTTIYIGHPAFKAMGATTGYSYINGFCVLILGTFDGASFLNRVVPQIAGVGLLMWIGIVVTAQAFDIQKSHAVAVALGLLPALAAWCLQNVEAVIEACSKLLDPTGESPLPWSEIMKTLEGNGVRMYGLISLSRGYLLSSIFLSSTLVHIIERQFMSAAMWMLVAAFLSFVGAVHSFQVTEHGAISSYGFPAQGPDEYPLQYATVYFFACVMLVLFEVRESETTWRDCISAFRKDVSHIAQDIEVNLRRNSYDDETLSERTPLVDGDSSTQQTYS